MTEGGGGPPPVVRSLARLELENVRKVRRAALDVVPGLNLFCGPNGAGKTSLLEAVHLLSTGRSFRTARVAEVVSRGESRLWVRGDLCDAAGETWSLGLEKAGGEGGTRYRLSGRDVQRASEVARLLPVTVVTPDSHRLLTDGSELRRRLIDWTLFHVEPRYHEALQAFRRVLRQRNELLRSGSVGSLAAWDRELVTTGEAVHELRADHLEGVLPHVTALTAELTGIAVRIDYRRGWNRDRSLAEALEQGRASDLARGFSGSGPHRADLDLRVEGRPAAQVVSRGEGKLLTLGLLLAQARHLALTMGRTPLVLVDDLASELDAENRGRVFEVLRATRLQTVVTAVSDSLVPWADWPGAARFHVERGEVREVI